jgi:hypothetical protein
MRDKRDHHGIGRAAVGLETAKTMLVRRMRLAHEQGESLRVIAEWANMSHEQVRRMIRSDQS